MGSWFSNLHVRKTGELSKDRICSCISSLLTEQGYTLAANMEEADVTVAVVAPNNSRWISICSKAFAHDDPDSCKAIAMPLSSRLHTDILGIACFDSDYLYLNLINADENVDAWVGIGAGKELGITRRNNLTAWKKKIANNLNFSVTVKKEYICTEGFLEEIEGSLELPAEQGSISLDYLKDTSLQQDALFLYFCKAEESHSKGPNIQICYMRYAVPCFDGKENSVTFLNTGNEFCGLSVYFLGPYVEHEEISFSDIRLGYLRESFRELELQKIQLSGGQWAYYSHIPDILIPSGIRGRMKPEKRYQLEQERMRKISFIPHGNPRKMLDITILITPDGDPGNQAKWNIWQQHGTKEEFIKHHNKIWKQVRAFESDPNQLLPLLKLEDFDE